MHCPRTLLYSRPGCMSVSPAFRPGQSAGSPGPPIVPVVGQAARAEGFEDQGVEPVKQRVQKFAAAAGDQLVEKYLGIHGVIEDGGAGDGRLVVNIKNNTIFLYDSDLRIIDAGKGIIALGPLFFLPECLRRQEINSFDTPWNFSVNMVK